MTIFQLIFITAFLLMNAAVFGQSVDSLPNDELERITIQAFEQSRSLKKIPAAVNFISNQAIQRFSPASILMAINSAPGTRMEERSPGSYRINIRGSAVRSPFGVRNVKIYYNDLPVTDPGGNSFFNQFAPGNFNSIEIIKGPGSSVYGSGTGGVMLLESMNDIIESQGAVEYVKGSFGLDLFNVAVTSGREKNKMQVSFQSQDMNGYRAHSKMNRKVLAWNGKFRFNKSVLKTSILLGDLFYQTPGALNINEYVTNPRQARPGTSMLPGAVQNNASIHQQSFLTGISWLQQISYKLKSKTTAYGMFTRVENPSIRNYGKTSEPHTGARSVFYFDDTVSATSVQLLAGGEWQKGFPVFETFKNNYGKPDSLLWLDEVNNTSQFIFSQIKLSLASWTLEAGASLNRFNVSIQRFSPSPTPVFYTSFRNEIAPRIAILKSMGNTTLYSGISKGFSPPSVAELNPSGSAVNLELKPEQGINYELGFRSRVGKINIDINAFYFKLKNTIVLRRDAAGGDYYINSGKTRQRGIESAVVIPFFHPYKSFSFSRFWLSHTWHEFRYKNFIQLDNDYSGNRLPGVPAHTLASGFDINMVNNLSAFIHYFFSDKILMNDANTASSPAYHLLGLKLVYAKTISSSHFAISMGAENLLNETYSLGNDINAFAGRYFNAAPARNFYVGLRWMAGRKD